MVVQHYSMRRLEGLFIKQQKEAQKKALMRGARHAPKFLVYFNELSEIGGEVHFLLHGYYFECDMRSFHTYHLKGTYV